MNKQTSMSGSGFKTFEQIEKRIAENLLNGYESAILGKNMKAIKYGSLCSDQCELPDSPKNCTLFIWNNENINSWLKDNGYSV